MKIKLHVSPWELGLACLVVAAGIWSATLSPYYLSVDQILDSTRQFIIPGLLALGLTIVVITGEVDISVASILAVGTVVFSKFSAYGVPLGFAVPLTVAVCSMLGALNGLLVARFGLPALAVTLGAMGAYRGVAFIIGSAAGYTDFDESYLHIGSDYVASIVPISLVMFLLTVMAVGFLLHCTVFGRRCFAVGKNKDASWIVGINVTRLKIIVFTLSGTCAGLAALVWIGQYGSARGDNADGLILFVVTAVVLAGVSIDGGKGTILGLVLALLLLGTLRNGMGLANMAGPTQTLVFGTLLVAGVLRPMAVRALKAIRHLLVSMLLRHAKLELIKS